MSAAAPPLAGWRVAVTRPADTDVELARQLAAAGAAPGRYPLTETVAAPGAPLHAALAGLAGYDWLVFTSANAVRFLARELTRATGSAGLPPSTRIACVGPATAAALAAHWGREPDAVSPLHTGAALPAAMDAIQPLSGTRVFWPRAARAGEALARAVGARGACLDAPILYRTIPCPEEGRRLSLAVSAGRIDALTFTAPSAVACYMDAGGQPAPIVAVIGPTTGAAAVDRGLPVHVQPREHTINALVAALIARAVGQ